MKNIEMFGSPWLFEMSFLFVIVYAQPKPLVIKKCIDKQIECTPPVGIDRILSLQSAYFIDIGYYFSLSSEGISTSCLFGLYMVCTFISFSTTYVVLKFQELLLSSCVMLDVVL